MQVMNESTLELADAAYERLLNSCITRDNPPCWEDILTLLRERKKWRMNELRASVLQADGVALVPLEPTLAQHTAAMEFAIAHMKAHGVTSLSPFKDYPPLRETTAGMYRAMVSAAPDLTRPQPGGEQS